LWYRLHFFHIHCCCYKQFWLKKMKIYISWSSCKVAVIQHRHEWKSNFPAYLWYICHYLIETSSVVQVWIMRMDTLSNYASILNKKFRPILWSKYQLRIKFTRKLINCSHWENSCENSVHNLSPSRLLLNKIISKIFGTEKRCTTVGEERVLRDESVFLIREHSVTLQECIIWIECARSRTEFAGGYLCPRRKVIL